MQSIGRSPEQVPLGLRLYHGDFCLGSGEHSAHAGLEHDGLSGHHHRCTVLVVLVSEFGSLGDALTLVWCERCGRGLIAVMLCRRGREQAVRQRFC